MRMMLDTNYVYLSGTSDTTSGTTFERISFATGSAERLASSERGVASQVRLGGNTAVYQEGESVENRSGFFRFDSTALAQTPTQLAVLDPEEQPHRARDLGAALYGTIAPPPHAKATLRLAARARIVLRLGG